jgi:hypothetical protein
MFYSCTFFPNLFSRFNSSTGIKGVFIIMNIKGKIKLSNEPNAVPNKIDATPKYIGWRLIRNGPDTRNDFDSSCSNTVVFLFLNNLSVQRLNMIPKRIGNIPINVNGK